MFLKDRTSRSLEAVGPVGTLPEADLASLLDVVGNTGPDDGPGVPVRVLESLLAFVHADNVSYLEMDVARRTTLAMREAGALDDPAVGEEVFWEHYWDCEPCCYPDRTGDRKSVTLMSDFYSARELHATGMYTDYLSRYHVEHEMMVCLPSAGTFSRRLVFFRGPGPGFNEQHRLVMALLRPHLAELYERVQRARVGAPNLTTRQRELLGLVAAGWSNDELARGLTLSPHTVRKHLENIFARLGVTSRTAAVAAVRQCEPSFPGSAVSWQRAGR